MRLTTILFILLFPLASAIGQANRDPLWRIWEDTTLHDTVRVKAFHKYIWGKYLYSQPDSAEYYGQIMYDFAAQRGMTKWMAWAIRGQGVSYKIRGASAKALDYWLRSERMSLAVNDLIGVAGSVNNIGILYFEQGDLPHALEYHKQSLALRRQCNDSIGEGASLTSIGDILRLQGQLDSARAYQELGLRHHERIKYPQGVGIAHLRLGDVHRDRKEFTLALEHFTIALRILREVSNELMMAECLTRMGLTQMDMGDPTKALVHCQQSLALADSTMNLSEQMRACDCLYTVHRAMDQRDQALYHLERSRKIADSLRFAETAQKLQYMEFAKQLYADSTLQAERGQREALVTEAALTHERTRKNILFFASISVLALAGGLWSRLRYIRRSSIALEREMERSDKLLLNILPTRIAQELKDTGSAEPRNHEQVSILFTDFKEFTQTSERWQPKELVGELNLCFEAFDRICDAHGIEKIKTIGDAYMAAGGLHDPTEGSACSTVLAALEMQVFMAGHQADRRAKGLLAFEMRVGIHTGPVVSGIVGVKKFAYDIWGDTVNTASRMETSGEVGEVNISEATYALVREQASASSLAVTSLFDFTPRGKVQVKGKGEMEMYFVRRSLG